MFLWRNLNKHWREQKLWKRYYICFFVHISCLTSTTIKLAKLLILSSFHTNLCSIKFYFIFQAEKHFESFLIKSFLIKIFRNWFSSQHKNFEREIFNLQPWEVAASLRSTRARQLNFHIHKIWIFYFNVGPVKVSWIKLMKLYCSQHPARILKAIFPGKEFSKFSLVVKTESVVDRVWVYFVKV